jgi:predicted 3-demethylubiquinone-9 3-methyltransferase (glyoxalase superfamily)
LLHLQEVEDPQRLADVRHLRAGRPDVLRAQRRAPVQVQPAVSFFISCKDQKEVDYYWNKLLKGGQPSQCGWVQDKYGLSWQVVPEALGECLGGKDRKGAERAMQAMMAMVKLNVKALKDAYAGKPAARRRKV